jgi:hypothetical protein|tara:strand:- start:858 stop:1124 length:267 start_codon:yes stop_codon:yes gene_type:complete
MDKAEFIEVMRRVEEAVPDKASPEILSLIIANLVLLFEQHAEWPQIILSVTSVLNEAIAEDQEQRIIYNEEAAVRAADEFMAGILNKQ